MHKYSYLTVKLEIKNNHYIDNYKVLEKLCINELKKIGAREIPIDNNSLVACLWRWGTQIFLKDIKNIISSKSK